MIFLVLLSIQAIDLNKFSEVNIEREDIKFLYRGSSLPDDLIIISAKLKCSMSNKVEIEKNKITLLKRKNYLNQVK